MRPEFGNGAIDARFKHAFEIARTGKSAIVNDPLVPRRSRDFARPPSANSPRALLCCTRRWPDARRFRRWAQRAFSPWEGNMVAEKLLLASWRRGALGLAAAFALAIGLAAAAAASEPPPAAGTHTIRFHSEMDQRLPQQARTQRRPGAGAYPQRHAGLQGRRNLGRLCRLHRRRHRRQSRPRRGAGEQNADDRAGGSMGAGAGDRVFRPAELEELAADFCRPAADAPRHDRQIPRRQAADPRSDRLSAGKARHDRQDQGGVEDRRATAKSRSSCRRAPS